MLTASRLAQPLSEAPSAMTVIDRDMIKASGFRTVPELMRLVPGMYVGFASANRPVVSLHGSGDEYAHRMQVLIDGRSVYMPPFGNVNWASLPVQFEDIERIEVVRGPSSASHGSNSFYGVINIITYEASSHEGTSVTVNKGAVVSDVSARVSQTSERFDYWFSAGERADQGLDIGKLNDYSSTRLYNFRANYHPNFTDSLDVQIGGSRGVYGLGIVGRPEDAFRESTAQSEFQLISWQHLWNGGDESKLTYSRTTHNAFDPYLCINSNGCQGFPAVQPFIPQSDYSQRNELGLQNTHQLGRDNRLVWGGGMRRDFADYSQFLDRPATVSPWRIFAHDEWRITQAAVLNFGTMYENDALGNTSNSPRATLNYHLTPQHTVRFGISTATRSPVMAEAFIKANNTVWGGTYVAPITPLVPEQIESREIGYMGEFRELALTLDVRLYQERVKGLIWWDKLVLITADPNNSPDSFKNLFSTEYTGADATVKYFWNEARSFMMASYAFQQASAGLSAIPTQYFSSAPCATSDHCNGFATWGSRVQGFYQSEYLNQYSQTVPTHSLSLLVSQTLADTWQLSGGYYYRTKVRVGDVSPDVTPEFTMRRLDLRLAKTFKFEHGRDAEVALVVQNATQDDYTKYGTVNAVAEVVFTRRGWLTFAVNY